MPNFTITCPICKRVTIVGHLAWTAIECQYDCGPIYRASIVYRYSERDMGDWVRIDRTTSCGNYVIHTRKGATKKDYYISKLIVFRTNGDSYYRPSIDPLFSTLKEARQHVSSLLNYGVLTSAPVEKLNHEQVREICNRNKSLRKHGLQGQVTVLLDIGTILAVEQIANFLNVNFSSAVRQVLKDHFKDGIPYYTE